MNEKKYIDLRQPGKNGSLKGVFLKEKDIWKLLLLHHFREITIQQLYVMVYPEKEEEMLYSSITKKMRKWEVEKRSAFVKSRPLYSGSSFLKTKLIRLTGKGFNLLEKYGLIPEGENLKIYKLSIQSQHRLGLVTLCSKLIHTIEKSKGEKIGMSENEYVSFKPFLPVGIYFNGWVHTERKRTFIENRENEGTLESVQLYSINPTYHPYRLESVEFEEGEGDGEVGKERLQPDWIFLYNDQVLNIEVDTGTESHTLVLCQEFGQVKYRNFLVE